MTSDRLRTAALANHVLHGADGNTVLEAYDYLVYVRGGEIGELLEALEAYVVDPTPGNRAHVMDEVADCVTILDFIAHTVGGGSLVDAVEAKLAADRVKLAKRNSRKD